MDVWKSVMRKDIEMDVLVAWTRIRFLALVRVIHNSSRSCISPVCLNWNFNLSWTSLSTLAADFAVSSLNSPENIRAWGKWWGGGPSLLPGKEVSFSGFICANDCVERIIQQSEEIWWFILAQGSVSRSNTHCMLLCDSWDRSLMKETVS